MTRSINSRMLPQIEAVRNFARFQSETLGGIEAEALDGSLSLAELRVMEALARRPDATAKALVDELGLDPGYLSRILAGLQRRRLLKRGRAEEDKRQLRLSLSPQGRVRLKKLNHAIAARIGVLLGRMPPGRRRQLVDAMQRLRRLLSATPGPLLFRQIQPGDIGWITYRHGALIADEYGYIDAFELLVAGILVDFVRRFDPESDRSFVAERDGDILGSILLVREDAETARLRLLYVDDYARGEGLGTRLVEKALRFAASRGYKRARLFTSAQLTAARHIYDKLGFVKVAENVQDDACGSMVGEVWEKSL